jgi:hypothetical protein
MKNKAYLVLFLLIIASIIFLFFPKPNGDLEKIQLPRGYTLKEYDIREVTGEKCSTSDNCTLPSRYAIQSNCGRVASGTCAT